VAADALVAVHRDGAYLNLLLPRLLRERGISGRDAAFATEICYGTARRYGVLDTVLAAAGGRDPAGVDPEVRAVLELGAYQLLHTRVPPHAAISSSVDLIRAMAGPKPPGLVNAILRRVLAEDWTGWVRRVAPPDRLGSAAFAAGYPRWIAEAISAALGGDIDAAIPAMTDAAPAVHLAARPGRIDRATLLTQAGPGAHPGELTPWSVILSGGDPADLAAVRSGQAAVQDEGSQLVASLLVAAPSLDGDGGQWLDLCAGPGGKAALLAGLLPQAGRLLAADRAPHRARLVAVAIAGGPGDVIVADGNAPAWAAGRFDRVLVDSPCSGLGALRRRPEARWRRGPEDVARLTVLQRGLLHAAVDAARPGGVVAYATCSPHLAETRDVVDEVIAGRTDAERMDVRAVVPGMAVPPTAAADPRDLQLWPHLHGTDAMFAALIRVRGDRSGPGRA
jgi:16S rRNA (cytosine967-C5)-methyltransferase